MIAISCNKNAVDFFTPEIIYKILLQVATYTNKLPGVLIGDEIMIHNEIAANMTRVAAYKKAIKIGDYLFNLFESVINGLPAVIRSCFCIFAGKIWPPVNISRLLNACGSFMLIIKKFKSL